MHDLLRITRFAAAVMVAAFALGSATSPSYADTGTVRIRIAKAGFIFGVGGGSGTLHFKGHTYRLRIDGISAGTIGFASVDVAGTASNLRTAADIAGSYSVVSAGIAVAGVESPHGCKTRMASFWMCAERRSVLSSPSA